MNWLAESTRNAIWLARYLSVGAVLVLLTGCVVREPEARIVRVEVPVLVPCKTQAVLVPFWAADGLKRTDSLEVKVRALLAERRQRIGYGRELMAANRVCQ